MPKIIVLDGWTISPLQPGEESAEHPNWNALAALGELIIHPRTPPSQVAERLADAEIALTNKALITREVIGSCPALRYIGVMATGTDNVDLEAAKDLGITVTNVPGYSAPAVVQTTFALLFELAGRVGETALAVRGGAWAACEDFSFTLAPWHELCGKTFGIVGFGEIGAAVARVASALGMKVLAYSRTPKPGTPAVAWVTLEELLSESDVVSLHCPLTTGTRGLINAGTLAKMKPGAFLLNTGRGPLVVEEDVAAALHSGKLGGYGADVLCREPPSSGNPLTAAPRSVITPHLAWASVESRFRLMDRIAMNLQAFLSGSPVNVVNR